MGQFRYRMVTGDADLLVEILNSLGQEGWRLVSATSAGEVWSALLEQALGSPPRRTTASRARVEVRLSGEVVENVVEADGLSVVDGVVYLRRGDELLATHPVDDLVAVDWFPVLSYAQLLERKRRDHPRHGEPWSPEEDDQLRQEDEARRTVAEDDRRPSAWPARSNHGWRSSGSTASGRQCDPALEAGPGRCAVGRCCPHRSLVAGASSSGFSRTDQVLTTGTILAGMLWSLQIASRPVPSINWSGFPFANS